MHEGKNITTEPLTLPKVIENLESGHYAIPVFQRDFVWEIKSIKDLWDSIYRHYPIGSFLIWETNEKLPSHRNILDIELKASERGTFNYILDGQQRITSLIGSIRGAKRKSNASFKVFFNLKKALEEQESKQEQSLFLDEKEFIKSAFADREFIVPVSSLIFFDTKYYKSLIKSGNEKLADFYLEVSERLRTKYQLSVIRLNKIPIEEIPEIFTRVNQKGKKLSLEELMIAKTYKQDEFYLKDYLEQLEEELEADKYSGIDNVIFLRVISVNNIKSCKEKELLALDYQVIKELWKKSSLSYKHAIKFFKEELNIGAPELIPYPPMLISLSYFFYKLGDAPLKDEFKDILKRWFWINSITGNYQGATLDKIHNDCLWFEKVLAGEKRLNVKFNKKIETQEIIDQEISLTSAFCKSILCLMANRKPIDFKTHHPVRINDIFIESKKDQLHHFFPIKSEVGKKNSGNINSIANICFLPRDSNIKIRNQNPSIYLKNCKKENKSFENDIATHLIPLDKAISDNYADFLNERAEMIKKEIYNVVGISDLIEEEIESNPNKIIDKYEIKIRELLDDYLTEKYGEEYWEKSAPQDIREQIAKKVEKEIKTKPYLKDELSSSEKKLQFCDIMDYSKIILKNWDVFEEIFGSKEELETHFKSLKNIRNPVKHIRDIDEIDKIKGKAALMWLEKCLKIEEEIIEENMEYSGDVDIDSVFSKFKQQVLSLGNDIKFNENKYYSAFKRKNNFASFKIQSRQIKLWVRVQKDKLIDPLGIARDVTKIGHHGTGNFEIIFSNKKDLPYILNIVKIAYELDKVQSAEYDLTHHLSKIEDSLTEERILELTKRIKDLDSKIEESFSKFYINYSKDSVFCAIYCQKNQFWLDLKLSKKLISSKDLDIRDHKDEVWTHIRVNNQVNLSLLIPYIKIAFDKN